MSRAAYSQQAIVDALSESPGFIPLWDLVRRVYGDESPESYVAFRNALSRLRERCPGLEIESVPGYRLRAGRTT